MANILMAKKPIAEKACAPSSEIAIATAAIPITRFGGKVLVHSANSIAVSKCTFDHGIKLNSNAEKSDRSCRNGLDTATGFLK